MNSSTLHQGRSWVLPALLRAWNEWDVRVMVVFSLLLQITVSVLGKRRKYTTNLLTKMVLWCAYLSADWIAAATLGKLSRVDDESNNPATNVLRQFWAPLLILHLGGPDTITAYSIEDNGLWRRHLLTLVAKSTLVIYIIVVSWIPSWISLLNVPLVLAAIAKYAERVWCLALANSQKRGPMMNIFNFHDSGVDEFSKVVRGYCLFYLTRPDVNSYLSDSIKSAEKRMQIYRKEILDECTKDSQSTEDDVNKRIEAALEDAHSFKVAAVELELIFDVTYTKSAIIYTKPGCFLRLTSFACCLLVVLVFLIRIVRMESAASFSKDDVIVTGMLLIGTISLELYAAWIMISSNWAILVANFHHNKLISRLFSAILGGLPCLKTHRKKLDYMGQFDLLEYCLRYKKKSKFESFPFIGDIIEMWHRNRFSGIEENAEDTMKEIAELYNKPFQMRSRIGGLSQGFWKFYFHLDILEWTVDDLDLDHSIIVWHLATSVCCHKYEDPRKETYKVISNYMMYLLVMRPALILPTESKSFFLHHASGELKQILSDSDHCDSEGRACEIFYETSQQQQPHHGDVEDQQLGGDNITRLLCKVIRQLNPLEEKVKWKKVKRAWLKLLIRATCHGNNINHVKQLGEGAEFISLLWLLVTNNEIHQQSQQMEESDNTDFDMAISSFKEYFEKGLSFLAQMEARNIAITEGAN